LQKFQQGGLAPTALLDLILDIRPIKGLYEDLCILQGQRLLNVLLALGVGTGSECNANYPWEQLPEAPELIILGTKLWPSLGNTVGFINGKEIDGELP